MDTSIAIHLGPLTIRWYGILIAVAFALGSYLAYRETKRLSASVDELLNILIIIIISSIIGARLYYVIMRWDYYSQHPAYILQTWLGGLAIHGGLIAAILSVLVYCRLRNQRFFFWADILIPAVALGQAIGRWGNFFNQEAYGYPTNLPWAMYIDGAYRHPTFLYESLWDLLVFALLYFLIRRRRHHLGAIFAFYLIIYSVGRFFIEPFRTDSLMIGPLRAAMVVSALCLLAGVLLLYYTRRQPLAAEYQASLARQEVSRQSQGSKQKGPKKSVKKKRKK